RTPRRVDPERTLRLEPGEQVEEWIDLRMYCFGRDLTRINLDGATLTPRYGFTVRGRDRWIARSGEAGEGAHSQLDGAPLTLPALDSGTDTEDAGSGNAPGDAAPVPPIEVELAPADAHSESSLTLRVSLGAAEGQVATVY